MKTSCSFIAYKHRHRYYYSYPNSGTLHLFESLEGGGGGGQPHSKNFDEQKEKRKKENSEILKSGVGGTPL